MLILSIPSQVTPVAVRIWTWSCIMTLTHPSSCGNCWCCFPWGQWTVSQISIFTAAPVRLNRTVKENARRCGHSNPTKSFQIWFNQIERYILLTTLYTDMRHTDLKSEGKKGFMKNKAGDQRMTILKIIVKYRAGSLHADVSHCDHTICSNKAWSKG